jgi:hypothetical protein
VARDFSLSKSLRPTLGPTKLPIQWQPGAPSPEVKQPERETDYSPTLVPILRMNGAIPLLPLCVFKACTRTAIHLTDVLSPEVTFRVFTVVFFQMVVVFGFLRGVVIKCSDVSEERTVVIFRTTE